MKYIAKTRIGWKEKTYEPDQEIVGLSEEVAQRLLSSGSIAEVETELAPEPTPEVEAEVEIELAPESAPEVAVKSKAKKGSKK